MNNKIIEINLIEQEIIRNEKYKNERMRFISDIIKENEVTYNDYQGPYKLQINIANNKLILTFNNSIEPMQICSVSMMGLRKIMKDYSIICESYYDAVSRADPRKIEAIDMGRRGLHNEGAEILQELLGNKINMDFNTARNLFALISLINIK